MHTQDNLQSNAIKNAILLYLQALTLSILRKVTVRRWHA